MQLDMLVPSTAASVAAVLCLSVGLVTACGFWLMARHYGAFRPKGAPPLVTGLIPLIGCWFDMWRDPVGFLEKTRDEQGDTFAINMAHAEMVWCFDPKILGRLFKSPEKKMSMLKGILSRGIMVPLIGEKLPTSTKEIHHHLRSRLDVITLFKRKYVPRQKKLAADFELVMSNYMEEINAGDSGILDSRTVITDLTVRMAIVAVCGKELHLDKEFQNVAKRLPDLFDEAESTIFLQWIFLHRRYRSLHRTIREKLTPSIMKRQQWMREDPENWKEKNGLTDLLSVYIDSLGVAKDEDEAQEQIRLCIFVCSNSLFGTLANMPNTIEGTLGYILSQKNLYEEAEADVDAGYREADGNVVLGKFPFLDACFQEYVRMWPVLFISRYTETEFDLPNGYTAKPGTVVNICPRLLMRDPVAFPEPNKYNPYRIYNPETGEPSPELSQAQRDMIFMPFGHGRHRCAGMNMAFSEMKVCIGMLLRSFHLEMLDPFPGTKYIVTNTAQLKNSVRIKYTRRATPLGL